MVGRRVRARDRHAAELGRAHDLANDAYETFTWEPGYVTNYENIVFDREGGYTASYMETLLMGPERIEVLSKVPRTLTVLCDTAS